MDTQEFVKTINKGRLFNKDKWFYWSGEVNGKNVSLKAFNTWVQLINIDQVSDSGPYDCSVSEFKQFLTLSVN